MPVDKRRKTPHPAPVSLGVALRAARKPRTQDEMAEALGVDQATISKWERGVSRPTLEEIRAFEEAAGRARGSVLVATGSVELKEGVELAITADDRLGAEQKDYLLNAYRMALRLSEEIAGR